MSIADANPYLLVMINGFFTGLGVIVAQWMGDKYIKPRLDKVHKRSEDILKPKKKLKFK